MKILTNENKIFAQIDQPWAEEGIGEVIPKGTCAVSHPRCPPRCDKETGYEAKDNLTKWDVMMLDK